MTCKPDKWGCLGKRNESQGFFFVLGKVALTVAVFAVCALITDPALTIIKIIIKICSTHMSTLRVLKAWKPSINRMMYMSQRWKH